MLKGIGPVVFVLLGLRSLISNISHGTNMPLNLVDNIVDGGCASAGDVVKAFGARADFVMLGGMMAGTKEGIRHEVRDGGNVEFYGSSTTNAQRKQS